MAKMMHKSHIKTVTALFILLLGVAYNAFAAPVFNAPAIRVQPNGDTLYCFLTGDEYYHRLHDANGFTIIQNPTTGFWVYADTVHSDRTHWELIATEYVAGRVEPSALGIGPNLGVDRDTWKKLQTRYNEPQKETGNAPKTSGGNHGTLNNIVIFIRFSDETEISTSFSTINAMFNDSAETSTSMYNYFKHASYNKIFIPTHYYPTPNGNNIVSYQDSLPRSYYMPYNATTAPNGYNDDTERRDREFGLLERAVNYVNANSPVPSTLNLDMDNDGYIDNICFVVKGTYTGWSDLLWPHKWSLWDRNVFINGKRVYTFNLQLEGSGEHYFSSSTFCHEMFHSLGAPDLYRYDVHTEVSGVGSWDLMCSNTTPPQHMSAYMKWKYGNWLDSIPEITVPGTYSLHSLADSDYSNCSYKIAAQEPYQWYILEYRDNTELFETTLSGRGLIIFRIDERYNGNAGYDGVNNFDEVYLFRPGGNNDTTNGNTAQAYYNSFTGRTSFTPTTNPHPWLTGNVIDTTIAITNIGTPGETISFTYIDLRGCRLPMNQEATAITGTSATLSWNGNAPSYRLEWRDAEQMTTGSVVVNGTSHSLTNLLINTNYEWRVRGLCSSSDSSDLTPWNTFRTASCPMPQETTFAMGDTTSYQIPINTWYNYTYSQMLYAPSDVGGGMNINKISFNYTSADDITCKNSCIIYMGHRSNGNFSSSNVSDLVPLNTLTKVYEGPFNFSTGWNTIMLDTSFSYNGTQYLVVAIDDNSGDYHNSSYKFSCTNTGNRYSSLTLYSDNENYNPPATSSSCSKTRYKFVPDIRFEGCPATQYYSVSIDNPTPDLGNVSGNGPYEEGTVVTINAQPANHCHFVNWQFPNGVIVTDNPYDITVDSNIFITAHFSVDSHTINVGKIGNGYVSANGRVPYGHSFYIYADPYVHNHFIHWYCENTGETFDETRITFTVTADSSFTAIFESDRYSVEVVNENPGWGEAWFTLPDSDDRITTDSVDYGTVINLHALPTTDDEEYIYSFEGWNDGLDYNPRQIVIKKDTIFAARFSQTPRPVGIVSHYEAGVRIIQHGNEVTIVGAEGRGIDIIDITGRIVYRSAGGHHNTATLRSGVYIVRIEDLEPHKIVVR